MITDDKQVQLFAQLLRFENIPIKIYDGCSLCSAMLGHWAYVMFGIDASIKLIPGAQEKLELLRAIVVTHECVDVYQLHQRFIEGTDRVLYLMEHPYAYKGKLRELGKEMNRIAARRGKTNERLKEAIK